MCAAGLYTTGADSYADRWLPRGLRNLDFIRPPVTDAPADGEREKEEADRMRRAYRRHYQREARESRRTVLWATILSVGLAISAALLLYRGLIIGSIL